MTNLRLEVGRDSDLRAASSYIRMCVFVLEKKIVLADEFDQNDTSDTIYSVLFDGSRPVATARLLMEDTETARIGRVATIEAYRGKQLGSRVVRALEDLAKTQKFKQILIHAELSAAGFYENLDYHKKGEPYEEDGVPCITLVKKC